MYEEKLESINYKNIRTFIWKSCSIWIQNELFKNINDALLLLLLLFHRLFKLIIME